MAENNGFTFTVTGNADDRYVVKIYHTGYPVHTLKRIYPTVEKAHAAAHKHISNKL